MKVFIILSVVLAGVLADEFNPNSDSNEMIEILRTQPPRSHRNPSNNQPTFESNRWERPTHNKWNGEWVSHASGDVNPEFLTSLLQQQQSFDTVNTNSADESSLGYWSSYPDAAAFDAKVKARLGSSRALADKPQVRRKIAELAEEKFNKCKGKPEDLERACLGRSTGQIMQLVAAVENMSRNPQ